MSKISLHQMDEFISRQGYELFYFTKIKNAPAQIQHLVREMAERGEGWYILRGDGHWIGPWKSPERDEAVKGLFYRLALYCLEEHGMVFLDISNGGARILTEIGTQPKYLPDNLLSTAYIKALNGNSGGFVGVDLNLDRWSRHYDLIEDLIEDTLIDWGWVERKPQQMNANTGLAAAALFYGSLFQVVYELAELPEDKVRKSDHKKIMALVKRSKDVVGDIGKVNEVLEDVL